MKRLIITVLMLIWFAVPVNAMEYTAPQVPDSAAELIPEQPESFVEGLCNLLKEAVKYIYPSLWAACSVCLGISAVSLLVSLVKNIPGATESPAEFAGVLGISCLLLKPMHTLIHLGIDTITELSDYGKLLLPVMAAATAAQGGTTSSMTLYMGTAFFDALLSAAISSLISPLIYIFICLSVAGAAVGGVLLEKLKGFVKWAMTWILKISLYIFTGYMGITGVISGSADAAAIKATKLTISGVVPIVGGILSDASEAVLVGAGLVKSAVGVYGVLAILAICVKPFVEIGIQYLLLKLTAAFCGIFGTKATVKITQDFAGAMGMILAVTATLCLVLLISTICLMRGVV